jgi:hypothetical protein
LHRDSYFYLILSLKFILSVIIKNLDAKSTAPKDFEPTFWFKDLCTSPTSMPNMTRCPKK